MIASVLGPILIRAPWKPSAVLLHGTVPWLSSGYNKLKSSHLPMVKDAGGSSYLDAATVCHAPIFWLREPTGFPQESDMQIRKPLKGDDYFKWYRLLMAIVENHGECAIPFGNPHSSAHSNL